MPRPNDDLSNIPGGRVAHWFRRTFMHVADGMDTRLLLAGSAGTPLTADEQAKLDASRAEFRCGDFVVDPATARDRDDLGRAASR